MKLNKSAEGKLFKDIELWGRKRTQFSTIGFCNLIKRIEKFFKRIYF